MKLQYIASACVLVEHNGVKVLCDPWLVDGAYGGAWYHNPPLKVRPEDFADVDYLHISHVHPDHFDEATLRRLPRVPVLLGRYAESFLGNKLRAMGFPILVGQHEIGPDFYAWVFPADDCNPQACGKWIGCEIKDPKAHHSYQIDTLSVFHGGGRTIVNVNDCPYELARQAVDRVLFRYGSPGLLCVGYAGAGPWPQCFSQLSIAEKKHEAEKKYFAFVQQMRSFVDHLQPKAFLPFAGQYTLGGSLVDLNDLRGVPELDELPDDTRMVRLDRNGWIDVETGEVSGPWTRTDRAELVRHRGTLRSKALDHEADGWPTDLPTLFADAWKAWRRRCLERGIRIIGSVVLVAEMPDGQYVTGEADVASLNELTISADARLWRRILTRRFNLNNAEVGSLLTFKRTGPYDRGLLNSLSYFHI